MFPFLYIVVQALVDACGHETLYMHSTLQLIGFYKTFGFVPNTRRPAPEDNPGPVHFLLR